MEQRFIKGDNLSFKEYLLVWNNPVSFHSLGKWFFFCTLKDNYYLRTFCIDNAVVCVYSRVFAKGYHRNCQILFFRRIRALRNGMVCLILQRFHYSIGSQTTYSRIR